MPAKQFETWVKRQILEEKKEEGTCIRIVVRHLSSGRKSLGDVEAISIPLAGDDRTEEFVHDTIRNLWDAAQNDANGLVGVNSYSFVSFRSENPNEPSARYTARFANETEEESEDASVSEPANKAGLTSQLMRHNESLMKMATLGSQQIINSLARQMSTQSETIERLAAKQLETLKVLEELGDKKQERDMERLEKEYSFASRAEMVDTIKPLIPVIASKLTGIKMLGSGKNDVAMKTILGSIKPEQFEALLRVLTPEQQSLLTTLMMEVQSEEVKEETH